MQWLAQFEMARTGAFRALTQMREQGIIKGWGLGVSHRCTWSLGTVVQ